MALAWALLATTAAAQGGGLVRLRTLDEGRGWEAVGRIDIAGKAFCTGTLISPSEVLTAAHCLYDRHTGRPHDPADMTFLAGWREGRAVAYRKIRRAVAHPDYVYEGQDRIDRVAYDLAILELDQPVRVSMVRPFAIGADPHRGDTVGIVSYAIDRAEAPSLEPACKVLGRQPGILVLTCSVDFGSSGAPIFQMQNGQPQIVSVVSAKAEMDGQPVALGTAMRAPLAELRAAFDATASRFRGVSAASAGVSAGGAKFVRP